jgi:hypothetical protein
VLLALIGPSGNALSQTFERYFHAVLLNLLFNRQIILNFLPLEYYLTPLRITTIIQGVGRLGKNLAGLVYLPMLFPEQDMTIDKGVPDR